MPQSLTNFDGALKDTYGPGLKNALNSSNVVLTEATRNEEDFEGRRAVWAVHTGRSASTSARAEFGSLHSADRQRVTQMNEDMAYLYHTIKVSGQAKHATKSSAGSFARALELEIDGAERDLKHDLQRQVVGQKLTVNSALASGVIATLSADPGTGTTLTFAAEPRSIMRHFFEGEIIQAINPSDGAVRAGGPYEVVSADLDARTVTIASAANAAIASGDFIVRAGAGATTAAHTNLDNEMNGLRHLISTQTFAGVNPATVKNWGALASGSSSTGISELVIDQAAEQVETDGNGESAKLFLTEQRQVAKLASQLQTQKRYEGRQTTLTAGWEGLKLARGTLVADRFVPSDTVFILNPKYLVRYVLLDWSWDDDDGRVLMKALDGADAVEARFKTYHNMVVTVRNAHSKLTLAEPVLT